MRFTWVDSKRSMCAISVFAMAAVAGSFIGLSRANGECPPHYTIAVVHGPQCGILGQGYAFGRGGNSDGEICGYFACGGGSDHAFVSSDARACLTNPS